MIALFIPGFVEENHAYIAMRAARAILRATGHEDRGGPWIPVGVGVHTGHAFAGKVEEEGVSNITVLGDAANVTARLATLAGPGEILISAAAFQAAKLPVSELEPRTFELRGRAEALQACSLTDLMRLMSLTE